jgi:hypothetical protein
LESRSKRVVGVVDDMHRYPPTGRREENVKRMECAFDGINCVWGARGNERARIELSGGVGDVRESENGGRLLRKRIRRRKRVVKREERPRTDWWLCVWMTWLAGVSQVHGLEG